MPDKEIWEKFFDVNDIFEKFELTNRNDPGADIACGFGTFTIPLALLNNNKIYAVDINNEFLGLLEKNAEENNLDTIKIVNADITDPNFYLPEKVGFILLFNILHCENPDSLVTNLSKNLTKDGKIYVIHWRSDIETPRGPPLEIRPTMDNIKELMSGLGFQVEKQFKAISSYHYGISFQQRFRHRK